MKFSDLIIHHDHHILVANKPSGMPVQKDLSGDVSLWDIAERYAKTKLHLHNRIDRPVSGVVLFSKSEKATNHIDQQNKIGSMLKKYWAIVSQQESKITAGELSHFHYKNGQKAICRTTEFDQAKAVKLEYKSLLDSENYKILEIAIARGRFHQIRAQLAAEKLHIKGDVKYGARRKNKDRSIHLHAVSLDMIHPSLNQKVTYSCLPNTEDNLWKFVIDNTPNK